MFLEKYNWAYFCVIHLDVRTLQLLKSSLFLSVSKWVLEDNSFLGEIYKETGQSPLHLTISHADSEMAYLLTEILLLCGQDPNTISGKGLSPMDIALALDRPDLVSLLARYNARFSGTDETSDELDKLYTVRFQQYHIKAQNTDSSDKDAGEKLKSYLSRVQDIFIDDLKGLEGGLKEEKVSRSEFDPSTDKDLEETINEISAIWSRRAAYISNTTDKKIHSISKETVSLYGSKDSLLDRGFLSVAVLEEYQHSDRIFEVKFFETRQKREKECEVSISREPSSDWRIDSLICKKNRLQEEIEAYPEILLRALSSANWIHDQADENWRLDTELTADFRKLSDTLKSRVNALTRGSGAIRSSFNYLLLDPRVCENLPRKISTGMSMDEGFLVFLKSIFYIGKGTRSRPFAHLYDAVQLFHARKNKKGVEPRADLETQRKGRKKVNCDLSQCRKTQRILDIWNEGFGIGCLQVFNNAIAVESFTKEAALIEAIGLSNVTNAKPGDYYGVATRWDSEVRQAFGVFLLYRAFGIFIQEGESQLRPDDLKATRP